MGSIRKNLIYNSIYQVMVILTPLITSPYISRVLGASGVGIYSYNYTVANYFLVFAMLGVANYGNRSIAKTRDNKVEYSKAFWSIYFFQIIFAIFIIVLYYLYFFLFSKANHLIVLIESLVVLSSLFDVTWLFFGLELFQVTTMRSIIVKLFTVLAILFLVKNDNDVWIYCLIMSLGILLNQMLLWPMVVRYIVWIKPTLKEIFNNLKPNLTLFLPVIAISLFVYIDKLMLGMYGSYTELGYFDNADKITSIPMSLITALGTVMLPRMSYIAKKKNQKLENELNEFSMFIAVFMSAAFAFGIMGVAEPFVPLFFGKDFSSVILLLLIMAPKMIFISWANIIRNQYLLPYSRDLSYTISVFLGAIVNLIINILLIPKYGAVGAAIGSVITEFLITVAQTLMAWNYMEVRKFIKNGYPIIIIGIMMYLSIIHISLASTIMTVLLRIIVGAVIYISLSLVYLLFFRKKIFNKLLTVKRK
ncbi:oligosaccharide flippase family protein [Lactiplantibacillus plantarum]|uniref:oligosaccharide flippase family protein n=1 Tax=Lactiplantibacillus plantarum TaxID=1590 RepID=UPI0023DF4A28|nr:oligosaccharide flippase family protein [Lactiplantibacillus plantarum]MDF3265835.1 oligosaccharide flippase family protein [Lactiplantibacillus plantarum]